MIATGANRSPYTGSGVTIGLVSSGVDMAHPAFEGIDFDFKDYTGEGNDPNDHGTHVLATVCGRAIDGRRIGVAPGVSRVILAKTLSATGSGNSEGIFDGTLWAARQSAQIILIGGGFDFPSMMSQLMHHGMQPELAAARVLDAYRFNMRLFDTLATACTFDDRPCLLIAPSGNESRREIDPTQVLGTALPASAAGFMSVAALKRIEGGAIYDIAPFSNQGDIAAPGVDIESAASGGRLKSMSGTSMAAPHVAGVAAL